MSNIQEENKKNQIVNIIKGSLKNISKILIPIIIIVILISSLVWYIFTDEGIWGKDEKGNPSSYTNNTKITTSEGVSVDKNALVQQGLLDMGYTEEKISSMTEAEIIEKLKMNDKLNKTVTRLEECTEAEILWCLSDVYSKWLDKPENLEYLLNAEIVTQYPKIDNLSSEKLNGIIQFKRIDRNQKEQVLEYLNPEDFETKYNNYIEKGNNEVFKYFTLDEEGSAVIASWSRETGQFESNNTPNTGRNKIKQGWTEETIKNAYDSRYTVTAPTNSDTIKATYTTYSASKTKINYKTLVEKYTLPFEYLWSLLVMGESYDFVENLAGLAYNSEIVIGIYDSTSTTVRVETNNYTENFRENYKKSEKREGTLEYKEVESRDWTDPTEQYPYYEKNLITSTQNTVQIDLIYANVWIVEVESKYKYIQSKEPTITDNFSEPDEEWSDNGSYTTTTTSSKTEWQSTTIKRSEYTANKKKYDEMGYRVIQNNPKEDFVVANRPVTINYEILEEVGKQKKTTGKSSTTQIDVENKKYEKEANSTVREKVDIDSNTDNNFVKLLRADEKAKSLLTSGSTISWLKEILENNQSTANMVDLTMYLINKTKDPSSTEVYDFSIFTPSYFSNVSGIYGDSIEEKVWFALLDAGFSKEAAAGALGNIHEESHFATNNLNNTGNRVLNVTDEEYTERANNGTYTQEQFADTYAYGLCQWRTGRKGGLYKYAKKKGVNIEDPELQINYLLAELTGKGEAIDLGCATRRGAHGGSTPQQWIDAATPEEAATHYCNFFETPGSVAETRKTQARYYYELFGNKTKPTVDSNSWTKKGVNIPLYRQAGQPWSANSYNYKAGGTIRSGGCGACSPAMAVSGLKQMSVTPDEIVAYLNSIGKDTVYNGSGSAKAIADKYGLIVNTIGKNDKATINAMLDQGKCLIFSVGSNGVYTGDGHYIICYGREGDKYYVIDSIPVYQMDVLYDYNKVFKNIHQGIFAIGK